MPNSSILVSSDHSTFSQAFSESFRCSLANFRWACTCAFLSRGILRALQDFSPSRRSVLPMVCLVTGIPTALRSLTRSFCVVMGWSLTFLNHPYPMRWDLAWSSRPRAIDGYFLFLPFPNNRTNSCLLLTKLFADVLVAHSSLVQILSPMSFDSSLVLPMVVESLEWKIQILWTAVFYTHNDLKLGVSS